ncbi:MAG: hypothetical protein SGBAC_011005 [Bacillariaceae sp.]
MSSNESSSWMSMVLMPGGASVSDCCNGFISWWTGGGTIGESANDNIEEESATTLVEPLLLVEEQVAQVMDEEDRLQIVESDLFLDEIGDNETQSCGLLEVGIASPEESLDIENSLPVTNDNEGVHSQLDNFANKDEHDHDERKLSRPLMEKGGSSERLDVEKNEIVTPHDDGSMRLESSNGFHIEPEQNGDPSTATIENIALSPPQNDDSIPRQRKPETFDGEPMQDEPQSTTAAIVQSSCNDGYLEAEAKVSALVEKSSYEPLETDNYLSTEIHPTPFADENDQNGAVTSSIFRRSDSQPFHESDTPIHNEDERIQAVHGTFDDEYETQNKPLSTASLVKKRVSGLIAIFESLSTDEGEENVTPTSLCSSSSFSAPQSAQDTCPCCNNKIYPTDATIAYHEKVFHGGCFKCHLCDRKFSRGMSEVAGMINHDGDDANFCMLSCTKCRDDAAVKHLPLRKSTPACQPISIASPEKGNIQQVKDEIGDDLESVMDGMIPRCTICGIHFLGGGESSDMMILGMNKYHRKCRMYGRPMVERCERKVLPIVAANYAPESLVVRISNTSSSSSTKEIMTTLYFMLPDKAADLQRIRSAERPNENVNFEYVMDSSAYANPNYEGTKKNTKTSFPCHGVGVAGSSISVGFLGDPLGLPIQLANARIEDRDGGKVFCAEMECFKFQLRHRFDLVMHTKEESSVDLKTATLSMNIAG